MFVLTSLADDTNPYEGIFLLFLVGGYKNDYQDVRSIQVLWFHAHFIGKCKRDSDALELAYEVQIS